MKDLFNTLFPYCQRYQWRYYIGFACVLLTNYLYVRAMVYIGDTVDYLTAPGANLAGVMPYLGLMLVLVFAGAYAQYLQRIFLIVTSRHIEFEFRNDFFKHLMTLSPSFYDRSKTGDIISRATTDIDQVRMAIGPGIMYPINSITSVPITLVAMCRMSWPVALACCAPLVVLPWFVRFLANALYHRSLRLNEHFSEFSGRIQESITGVRVIKSYVQAAHELNILDKLSARYASLNMSIAVVQAMFFPMMMLLFGVGSIIIIWVGAYYVVPDEAAAGSARLLTKGQLVSFTVLYGNLFFPLLGLGWVMSVYQRASASMHRLKLILNQKPQITDHPGTDRNLPAPTGHIEIRDLTFHYPATERPALRDINIDLAAGQTLGIIGPVGSGKSSIGQVLLRLYEIPPGTVFLDGVDIRKYPLGQLRESIGVVFQETYLFSDSILENICYGMTGPADREKAAATARMSDVANDIEELPAQYDAILGERGINLSGGQKQRVSLARALAADPPILILDDAFSAIDTHTEERILGEIRQVLRDRTSLLISHRISTVREADQIIVLDDGAIVEHGTHDQLVALGGAYANIHQRQKLEEAIEGGD